MTEEELRLELGRRLRAQRVSQGRTIASVAMQAGLSVPYVANLENGRGNPTLGSAHRLAAALGAPSSELLDEGSGPVPGPVPLPASLAEFSRSRRFQAQIRRQLLTAMAAVPQPGWGLDELDWHRILDAIILVLRPR